MDTVESADLVSERFLGVYSSEELAIEVANLASSPDVGEVKRYVVDEIPSWIEKWTAELAMHEESETS
jgi:hypothetical protein